MRLRIRCILFRACRLVCASTLRLHQHSLLALFSARSPHLAKLCVSIAPQAACVLVVDWRTTSGCSMWSLCEVCGALYVGAATPSEYLRVCPLPCAERGHTDRHRQTPHLETQRPRSGALSPTRPGCSMRSRSALAQSVARHGVQEKWTAMVNAVM